MDLMIFELKNCCVSTINEAYKANAFARIFFKDFQDVYSTSSTFNSSVH
jgi:hypothetical protein